MNRIDNKFEQLKGEGKKALIPFITAGDPDLNTFMEIAEAMEKAGADIIEIGIPYSDPLADGPVIQASSQRALLGGINISKIMSCVKELRSSVTIPLLYLVYYNSIFRYGMEKFMLEAAEAGIDGLIVPDLPIEERVEIRTLAEKFDIYLIPLIAPTSNERIEAIVKEGRGFIYCVSVAGVTGVRDSLNTNIEEYMNTIEKYSSLPKALGFGISGPQMAKQYKDRCDGIIVGSAFIKRIAEAKDDEKKIEAAADFVRELKEVL